MKHKAARNQFQAWREARLDEPARRRLEAHLSDCRACRSYFETMSAWLDTPDPADLPRLQPDPFLPTKIRAIVDGRRRAAERAAIKNEAPGMMAGGPVALGIVASIGRLNLTVMTTLLVLAAAIGIYFGRTLSTDATQLAAVQYSDSDLVSDFYDAFSASAADDVWSELFDEGDEEAE
jgi:predicted anti-sigma-YlaC factor YlaD